MRRFACSFLFLLAIVPPGKAQPFRNDGGQMLSCPAWRVRLVAGIGQFGKLGIVQAEDAAVANTLVEFMGKRCDGGAPQRVSQLYFILHDVVSDQRHQP
jgi:hypothetical protein